MPSINPCLSYGSPNFTNHSIYTLLRKVYNTFPPLNNIICWPLFTLLVKSLREATGSFIYPFILNKLENVILMESLYMELLILKLGVRTAFMSRETLFLVSVIP